MSVDTGHSGARRSMVLTVEEVNDIVKKEMSYPDEPLG